MCALPHVVGSFPPSLLREGDSAYRNRVANDPKSALLPTVSSVQLQMELFLEVKANHGRG